MERIFKKVITILKQNEVSHSVKQEDVSRTDFCMIDVYSVEVIIEEPVKQISKKRTKKAEEPSYIFVPILQIKHNPILCNIKIILNNECIYNNDNFQFEEVPSTGYTKNNANTESTENKTLKKILGICKKKSVIAHLDYLSRAKELLSEQRKALLDIEKSR
jgi:hypothetical protein